MQPCSISPGNLKVQEIKFFTVLHMSLIDCKISLSIDLGFINNFLLVKFSNKESINNED